MQLSCNIHKLRYYHGTNKISSLESRLNTMKEGKGPAPQISTIYEEDGQTQKDGTKSKSSFASKLSARRILEMMKPKRSFRLKKRTFERRSSSRHFTSESLQIINSPKVTPSGLDEVESKKIAVKDEQMRAYLTLAMAPETLVEEYLSNSNQTNESEIVTSEENKPQNIVEPDEAQREEDLVAENREVIDKEGEKVKEEPKVTFIPTSFFDQITNVCTGKF